MIWVWPRVKSAGAVRSRRDADVARDLADVLGASTVGTPLVDGDLLPDELLVDRLGRLLHELLRERVLDHGALAVHRRRADRERQLDRVDDPVEQQLALRRLELLRVLLRLGERAQIVLELLTDVALDDLETCLFENHVERRANLDLAQDVLLARLHAQLGRELAHQLLEDRAPLA